MLKQIGSWFGSVVHRNQFERDLDDEVQLHIALRADDLEASGVPRAEAERRARIEFGSAQAHKEDVRRSRGLSPVDGLGQDLRFVARSLRRNFLLSLAVIATLALTIGMTTGVFTLLEASIARRDSAREFEISRGDVRLLLGVRSAPAALRTTAATSRL